MKTHGADVIVVGRGAIGSLLAARLVREGLAVWQVSDGLCPGRRLLNVREPRNSWQAAVEGRLWIESTENEPAQVVIVAVKTTQLDSYLGKLAETQLRARIVSAHNGLPDLPKGAPATSVAVVNATADCVEETVVCHAFHDVVMPRSAVPGHISPSFKRAGFRFVPDDELAIERWLKLAAVTTGARMVLANASIGDALREPALRRDLAAVFEESSTVIAAGLVATLKERFLPRSRRVADSFRDGTLIDLTRTPMTQAYSSLHRDVERGRPTEIDSLNGAIVRFAAGLGMGAPLNRLLTDEIHSLSLSFATPATAARDPELQRRVSSAFSHRT